MNPALVCGTCSYLGAAVRRVKDDLKDRERQTGEDRQADRQVRMDSRVPAVSVSSPRLSLGPVVHRYSPPLASRPPETSISCI